MVAVSLRQRERSSLSFFLYISMERHIGRRLCLTGRLGICNWAWRFSDRIFIHGLCGGSRSFLKVASPLITFGSWFHALAFDVYYIIS